MAPSPPVCVSAVIPNYNHAGVLPQAIAALQGQSLPPDEIVVVDDGSTDDSAGVIARLAQADARIRPIAHGANRGAIAALNTGIGAATGDYVYLGAADDMARPVLLETLVGLVKAHPGLGLYCGEQKVVTIETGRASFRPIARPSQTLRAFDPAETRTLLGRIDNFILTGAALMDRRKLVAAGGLDAELGSFADGYAVRQLALRHGFAFVPEVLAEWRVSEAGLSRRTAADARSVERLLRVGRAAFARDPAFPSGYARLFERRWKFGVARLQLAGNSPDAGLLESVAPGPAGLRRLFAAAASIPVLGRPLALALLIAAYRPFSLGAVLSTALQRRSEHSRNG